MTSRPILFSAPILKAEREHTPPLLAEWLVELVRRCAKDKVTA